MECFKQRRTVRREVLERIKSLDRALEVSNTFGVLQAGAAEQDFSTGLSQGLSSCDSTDAKCPSSYATGPGLESSSPGEGNKAFGEISHTRSLRSRRTDAINQCYGAVPARNANSGTVLTISFTPKDTLNPQNYPTTQKWIITSLVGLCGALTGYGSAIDSSIALRAAAEFNTTPLAESLATGLYLIAFGLGAFLSAPLSETIGRTATYSITLVVFALFNLGSALSQTLYSQLICRFFAGFAGSTPLTTFGGSIGDLWSPRERTYVFPVCASLSFLGPFLAPTAGGFIAQYADTWRWGDWSTLAFTGIVLLGIVLWVPETYAPVLLGWRAAALNDALGQQKEAHYVCFAGHGDTGFLEKLSNNVKRPFALFFRNLNIILFTAYISLVYVVMFTSLSGFDFVFGDTYGFQPGSVGLMFVGMNVGFLVALVICPLIYQWYVQAEKRARESSNGEMKGQAQVPPEQRLWYAMIGAPWLPISLFWMAWTARGDISFWSPLIASTVFGFAVQGIYISTYQYLIDCFTDFAASALVSMTFMRYVISGGMAVAARPMYEAMKVKWTLTLMGLLSVVMTPIPYAFYVWGEKIRRRQ